MERMSVIRKERRILACDHICTLSPEGPMGLLLKSVTQGHLAEWLSPGTRYSHRAQARPLSPPDQGGLGVQAARVLRCDHWVQASPLHPV